MSLIAVVRELEDFNAKFVLGLNEGKLEQKKAVVSRCVQARLALDFEVIERPRLKPHVSRESSSEGVR